MTTPVRVPSFNERNAPMSARSSLLDMTSPRSSLSETQTTSTSPSGLSTPCYVHNQFVEVGKLDRAIKKLAVGDERAIKELTVGDLDRTSHSKFVKTATGVRKLANQLMRAQLHLNVFDVLIITKARDNRLVGLTRELAVWLMSRRPRSTVGHTGWTAGMNGSSYKEASARAGPVVGTNVYVDGQLEKSKRFDAAGILREHPEYRDLLRYWTSETAKQGSDTFDLVITLGGDGTVLYASGLFQKIVPPVMSFSLGSLGFLANFSFQNYQDELVSVLEGGCSVNLRMRFSCKCYDEAGRQINCRQVVNEVVIDRGPSPFISLLDLYGDGSLLTTVQADGLILSTPTGSTAYSLSAGGSLVHPEIPAMCITPICPHTLSFRPMLVPDSMQLKVCIPKKSRASAWASFDGRNRIQLKPGYCMEVCASQYPFPTIVKSQTEYIDSVSRSFDWNKRERQRGFGESEGENDSESTVDGEEFDIV